MVTVRTALAPVRATRPTHNLKLENVMHKISLALAGALATSTLPMGAAQAAGECATGKTLEEGVLTVATGNPAYFPWVIDNAPEAGEGFEAAVAYAVAAEMGFDAEQVSWTTSSFDQAIQPGQKNFDFNLQQFSITEDREKVVDFSVPYYTSALAVLVRQPTVDAGAAPRLDSLRSLLWGADANTTATPIINSLIAPESDPLLYDDTVDVIEAMNANQIDATLLDLPVALYQAAAVMDDGVVLGQFPAEDSTSPDRFGLLMEDGNPIKECVDAALTALIDSGRLAEIEAEWLQQATDVPVIE